nr:putative ribonuclease H-like domain-containing protein [Tanacetum cinerariifolium]
MKAKLALLEASSSSPQNPKTFQPKNKGLVAKIFDWDGEDFFEDEEVTQVKELMALADDELTVGKSHARNGVEMNCLVKKQAKLDAVTFQIQNTKLTKLNHALQEQLKEEKRINEKWLTSSKKFSQCISEQIPHQKKKILGSELLTKSFSKININENAFIPASMRILVPESQAVNESLETLNTPESSKDSESEFFTSLPPLKNIQGASLSSEIMPLTFQPHSSKERPGLGIMKHTKLETQDSSIKNVSKTVTVSETKQIKPSVPTEVKDTEQESKLNELTKLVQMLIDEKVNPKQMTQESSKIQKTKSSKSVDSSRMSQDSKPKVQNTVSSKSLRPKPIQKPQLKCELCHYTNHSTDDCYKILYCMICKREDHRNSVHEIYIASLKRSKNYKAHLYQYPSSSKQILKAKAKPFPLCTHCGFNDHGPDDYRNYTECEIYRSYDHSTSGHNCVIYIKRGVVPESSLSNESLIRVKCNTCRSIIHSTSNHNEFDHFKKGSVCIFFVWTCLDLKKSQAPKMIMSFVRMVENQNDIKVKQIITDYGTEFRNHELESFCDEKGISQNFSSPYTPEQNGVAEKKNKTLIEAARTIENGSVLTKHFRIKAVKIACYT